ncbi:hypothetical protein NEPAR05_1846 [Nematocida parisii]|uniref:IRE protein kinase n=1 Tax=Nematocida parisii (strain ERTm3) TaxID=935791 RepID=I3EJV7_NEMP3|nr:IRE protein kinase [Nematocida parisii ERTm3]KAI5158079.1 hypothetical protein NEPAR05_1846 [Nematocida parisii]
MVRVLAVLYFVAVCLCKVSIRKEKESNEFVLFKAGDQMNLYNLNRHRVIETFSAPLHQFTTVHDRITNIPKERNSGVIENSSNVNTLQPLPGTESIRNIGGIRNNENVQISRVQDHGSMSMQRMCELSGINIPGVLSNKSNRQIMSGGMVLSKEKRIGVEYIRSSIGVIVCVYNEVVTKIFREGGVVEYIDREITTIINRTTVCRESIYTPIISYLMSVHNTPIYLLKEIDNMYYFSQIIVSDVSEGDKVILDRVFLCMLWTGLSIGGIFLFIPVIIRIFGYKDNSIIINKSCTDSRMFLGTLFGKKSVFIRTFEKTSEKEVKEYQNLILLNRIQTTCMYTEETDEYYYMVYPKEIQSLSELISTPRSTIDMLFMVYAYVQELHDKGIAGVNLSVHNVFITQMNTILLLGVENMVITHEILKRAEVLAKSEGPPITTEHLHCIDRKHLEIWMRTDYSSLAELFYSTHTSTHNNPRTTTITTGFSTNKPFSDAIPDILLYDYRKYPKFIIDVNTKYQIELFDWISSLVTSTVIPSKVPHPLFWTNTQSLEFLSLFSDFVFDHPKLKVLETSRITFLMQSDPSNWDVYINADLLNYLTRNGKYYYNTKALRDLLRLIRNNGRHFQSIPTPGQEYFNREISVFITYFFKKFSYIILFIYYTAEEYGLLNEKIFVEVFQPQ